MGKLIRIAMLFVFILLALGAAGYAFVNYYGFIFARMVTGKVIGVQRVTDPSAIVTTPGGTMSSAQLYSFAIAIESKEGEIVTGSSEDRQWAVVREGQCAEAKYFPYPPWDLSKANTYHDVRLVRLFNCPEP